MTNLRALNGVIILDKPLNITSNSALQKVKRLVKARKAGHTGSLDPLATGVLPIMLGEATKFSRYLLDADKRYRVTAKFGIKTDTGDVEGQEIASRPVAFSPQQLEEAVQYFTGAQLQIPSMFSAIKHNGQPLYKLARQGITVEREARPITIHDFKLLSFEGDTACFDVHCTKGTYIRTLIDDLGEHLGCGAHVIELRRTQAGPYPLEQAVTVEQLKLIVEQNPQDLKQFVLPIKTVTDSWPIVELSASAEFYLKNGQAVSLDHQTPVHSWVSLISGDDQRFFGVGEVMSDGRVAPRRLLKLPEIQHEKEASG